MQRTILANPKQRLAIGKRASSVMIIQHRAGTSPIKGFIAAGVGNFFFYRFLRTSFLSAHTVSPFQFQKNKLKTMYRDWRNLASLIFIKTERARFELARGFPLLALQASALDHSATFPSFIVSSLRRIFSSKIFYSFQFHCRDKRKNSPPSR